MGEIENWSPSCSVNSCAAVGKRRHLDRLMIAAPGAVAHLFDRGHGHQPLPALHHHVFPVPDEQVAFPVPDRRLDGEKRRRLPHDGCQHVSAPANVGYGRVAVDHGHECVHAGKGGGIVTRIFGELLDEVGIEEREVVETRVVALGHGGVPRCEPPSPYHSLILPDRAIPRASAPTRAESFMRGLRAMRRTEP